MRGSAASAAWIAIACAMACGPIHNRAPDRVTLAVLPAESSEFPRAAQAYTTSLARAAVSGIDHTDLSKVSLEVVQLSIECVEPTNACYAQVGKSLHANRLLFAQLSGGGRNVKVTVTLFDVDAGTPKRAQKVFRSERAATAGAAELVAEATR
jgi:hypothetical protein